MNVEAAIRQVFAEADPDARPWDTYDGGYIKYMHALWEPVVQLMQRLGAPSAITEYNGAGMLINVAGENPYDYVWLGADEEKQDGPWLPYERETIRWIGGAHYFHENADDYGSHSDVVWAEFLGDPLDDYALAEAFVECWRQARDAPLEYKL